MLNEIANVDYNLISKCSNVFYTLPQYTVPDKAIKIVVDAYPSNSELTSVLIKVTIINSLYATQIYDTFSMANHITNINGLDEMLKSGNILAIDKIRCCNEIVVKKTGKRRDFYSFATKYCSFHNPKAYPIYDNLVADLLIKINNTISFAGKISRCMLLDYSFYVSCLNKCILSIGIADMDYKTADKGLWILAKYLTIKDAIIKHGYTEMAKNDKILFDKVNPIFISLLSNNPINHIANT